MANVKLSSKTELTTVADGDILHVVDVSDTTDGASGTSKKITRANILGSVLSGLEDVTASATELNVLDGIPSTLTATELGYSDGVTSAIQDQLDAKQATITGAATTIDTEDLTASRALVSNASGKVVVSDVTSDELAKLDGFTGDKDDLNYAKDLRATGVTDDEFDYLDGVSSNIQTQLDAKIGFSSNSITSSATPSPVGSAKSNDYYVTALAAAAEFAAPSGTPANGNRLLIRVKDDGTARALTWNAIYDGFGDDLPDTTTISKTLYIGFIYNSASTKWEMLAKQEEA